MFNHRYDLFLRALSAVKPYTPVDPTIRSGMLRATLGFDPFSAQGRASAPLPVSGALRGRGPLEFFGPKQDSLVAPFRREQIARKTGRPAVSKPLYRSAPPKMNRGDVGLALALSRKPRRG